MSYTQGYAEDWFISTPITTAEGTTTLVPAPGAGRRIRVQALTIVVTSVAVQTFEVEDSAGTVELFKAPVSLPIGIYPIDCGPKGLPLTVNTALQYTATAGVGLTISGFGWIQENAT